MSEQEPRVEDICGPGVDPKFDRLLWTLGDIARQKPKPLIDTIMYWRKSKGELAQEAKSELNKVSVPKGSHDHFRNPCLYSTTSRFGLIWHLEPA